jgi:hypothetical protein
MAISYVGGTSGIGTSADYNIVLTGLTGGSDSAPAANDIVIVNNGNSNVSNVDAGVTTAGYTEVTELFQVDTRSSNQAVSYKVMGGTPDTSVDVKGSGSATAGGATTVQVWRGVDTTTPMDVTATTAQAANSALMDAPSITPVTAGAIVVACGNWASGSQDRTATAPAGYSNHVYNSSTDPGVASGSGMASKAWSGSGAEDPGAWSAINTATADAWTAVTLALRPSSGGAAVVRLLASTGVGR